MAKLTKDEILGIVATELSGSADDERKAEGQKAMDAYLGVKTNVRQNRSSVVSTDIADSVEWILPELMKSFTQNNEVVVFDPVSSDDVRQAEIESRFVYDQVTKENNGFLVLYQMFKDALIRKNGFLKTYHETYLNKKKEAYYNLTEFELELLYNKEDVEVTKVTEAEKQFEDDTVMFDASTIKTVKEGRIVVECINPDNIYIPSTHNSVSLKNAKFIAQRIFFSRSDLVQMGYDKSLVEELPTANEDIDNVESKTDQARETVEIHECYLFLDVDGDGIAERCKVTVAGGSNPSHVLDVEEVDAWPFISATAIIMSHQVYGLSIYDRLIEIQKQKTSLLRNMLDNTYLTNNQRTMAVENMVNMDDLLDSKPGGVVRVKRADSLAPIVQQQLSGDTFQLFSYLDQIRAGRVGVSPDGNVGDQAIGDRVGSEGVERLLSSKEELVGLMVRVFAEVAIKPLCERIRDLLVSNPKVVEHYRFNDDWIQVNTDNWAPRTKTTIRVGTGSGNRKEQINTIMQLIAMQEKVLMNPDQAMVTEAKVFSAINDFAKLNGLPGAKMYFLDPDSEEGQENRQKINEASKAAQEKSDANEKATLDFQTKIANAEESKARTAEQNVVLTANLKQTQQQLEATKFQNEQHIKMLEQQLKEAKEMAASIDKQKELEFKYYDSDQRAEIERLRIAAKAAGGNNGG